MLGWASIKVALRPKRKKKKKERIVADAAFDGMRLVRCTQLYRHHPKTDENAKRSYGKSQGVFGGAPFSVVGGMNGSCGVPSIRVSRLGSRTNLL